MSWLHVNVCWHYLILRKRNYKPWLTELTRELLCSHWDLQFQSLQCRRIWLKCLPKLLLEFHSKSFGSGNNRALWWRTCRITWRSSNGYLNRIFWVTSIAHRLNRLNGIQIYFYNRSQKCTCFHLSWGSHRNSRDSLSWSASTGTSFWQRSARVGLKFYSLSKNTCDVI